MEVLHFSCAFSLGHLFRCEINEIEFDAGCFLRRAPDLK